MPAAVAVEREAAPGGGHGADGAPEAGCINAASISATSALDGEVPTEKAATSPSNRSTAGERYTFRGSSGSLNSVMSVTRTSPGAAAEKSCRSRPASTSSRLGAAARPSSPA